jgi:hypothetical protein
MTDHAAEQLATQAAVVRAGAGSGSRAVAEDALEGLRTVVTDLRASGALEADKAAEILAAAARVAAALDVMPTTTTTLPPVDDDGPGKGKGKGHGKGGSDDD